MKTYVIALVGVKTAGKSTVSHMINEFVPKAKETALADKLKNTCRDVFGIERMHFDRQDLKEVPFSKSKLLPDSYQLTNDDIGMILEAFGVDMSPREIDSKYSIIGLELTSPRHIAQIVGTEILRAAGDIDIHCKNVKIESPGVTIVSDCRFPNEFDYFSRMSQGSDVKFIPIYIQRDEAEKYVTADSHPSERCVFEFRDKCFKVDNNGSLGETERQVKAILDREMK